MTTDQLSVDRIVETGRGNGHCLGAVDDVLDNAGTVVSPTVSEQSDVPCARAGLRGEIYDALPVPDVLDLRHIESSVLRAPTASLPTLHNVPASVLEAMAALNLAEPFVPPMQSRASRFINLRGRGSYRGALNARLGGINRMIVFESLLELHCLHMLLADTAVIDIWDQAPPIEFYNVAGEWTEHTLDYRAEYASGYVGFAVKPWKKVFDEDGQPTEFALNMRRLRAAAGHEIRIVTERSFSRIQIQDARTMHRWTRNVDAEADVIVRGILPTLRGAFQVRTIRDLTGLEGRAFGAVVRAFREGLIVKAEKRRLDIDTLVQVNHG